MDFITLDDLAQADLADNAVLEYFGTLYEMVGNFTIDGERLLNLYAGYNDRKWVEALFRVAADSGCFRRPDLPIERALPFSVVRPLITNYMIADFCLADDILEAAFYEYILSYYQKRLISLQPATHEIRQTIKNLRRARLAFAEQKCAYLEIAYLKRVPHKVYRLFEVCNYSRHSVAKNDLVATLEVMPAVFEKYPRHESVDLSPVSKLYRKHFKIFAFCDEVITSLSV